MINPKNTKEKHSREERSEGWLLAIRSAGTLAATAQSDDELDVAIQSLQVLRDYLERRRGQWYQLPKHMPPIGSSSGVGSGATTTMDIDFEAADVIFSPVSAAGMTTHNDASRGRNQNPFAALGGADDDDDVNDYNSNSDDEENNGEESENLDSEDETPAATPLMTMRRLLIRVLASLSELFVKRTHLRQRQRRQQRQEQQDESSWSAVDYAIAFDCLEKALSIADEEYVRLFLEQEHDDNNNNNNNNESSATAANSNSKSLLLVMEQLASDAQVVMIAIGHFSDERDKFFQMAERRRDYLQHKLEPQWESRDQVKQKLGKDRWENNPRPKHDYARLRADMEEELRDVSQTMDQLMALQTAEAYGRSQTIYETASHSSRSTMAQHRYNNLRPNSSTARNARVSLQAYPDPIIYGWTFTGSVQESYVEFFEKQMEDNLLVKLDFYYTTGTVKTSMDHPTRGPNQLFGGGGGGQKVTPKQYRDILENPRTHTGVRYRTKQQQQQQGSHKSSRGGGRTGSRGGRGRGRGGRGRGSRNNITLQLVPSQVTRNELIEHNGRAGQSH